MKIERGRFINGLAIGIVYKENVHDDYDNKSYSQMTICFIAWYVCISWRRMNKTKKRSCY